MEELWDSSIRVDQSSILEVQQGQNTGVAPPNLPEDDATLEAHTQCTKLRLAMSRNRLACVKKDIKATKALLKKMEKMIEQGCCGRQLLQLFQIVKVDLAFKLKLQLSLERAINDYEMELTVPEGRSPVQSILNYCSAFFVATFMYIRCTKG